ncbi:unnamed protein product [Kuraishia capsulata CBS 1993]|uniref:Mannosyltransferase n=1 Tax=Kuraishia capsulata CBS 1993 TaxID=1382522 RepID=W6MXL5_9ASCO|nr:uncharacterized protein KUCA_T00005087001 [Kuraishia capsulata CBS 1993]CDK29100.1 unnamed protein product [Kuraishia capsulata CBS 1993]
MKQKQVLKRFLVSIRILCVFYGIISDCDEVFNYWEPLNFMVRGFGKQTWEYSPIYAIRSWAFLMPLNVLLIPLDFLRAQFQFPVYFEFYVARLAIAAASLLGELALYESVYSCLNHDIANWFLLFSTVAPGMSHASIAFLPSSFAMICEMFAISSSIRCFRESSTSKKAWSFAKVVIWTSLGGLLGWPFSLVLAIPFAVGVALQFGVLVAAKNLILPSLAVLPLALGLVLFESVFYGKYEFVPLNIVLYNVVNSSETSGPNIFGTEPLSYYVLNLLLNFNIIAVLAYVGCVMSPLIEWVVLGDINVLSIVTNANLPVLIWSLIFFAQPHKEERFLYPIYPMISLSAAILAGQLFKIVRLLTGKHIARLSVTLFAIVVSFVSVLRITSLMHNYRAPLAVYAALPQTNETLNVCVGREWYHYPSSFFLPDNARLKFVPSGFRGLLPDDFHEPEKNAFFDKVDSLISSTNVFNNENLYMEDKVLPVAGFQDACDYYVDVNIPVDADMDEVNVAKLDGWESVLCHNIIDPDESKGVGRLLYIPSRFHDLTRTKMVYHDYCLFRKTK